MNIQQQQEEALQARWARVQEARREHSSQQIQELQARRKRIQQTLETLDAYIDARIRKIETLDLELESWNSQLSPIMTRIMLQKSTGFSGSPNCAHMKNSIFRMKFFSILYFSYSSMQQKPFLLHQVVYPQFIIPNVYRTIISQQGFYY